MKDFLSAVVLIFVAEGAGRLIFRLNSRMKMSIISDKRKIAWRGSFPRRRFFRFGEGPVVRGGAAWRIAGNGRLKRRKSIPFFGDMPER